MTNTDKHSFPDSFFVIAGPCVIEGEEMALATARSIKEAARQAGVPVIFKGSYRKANRSRLDSFTGIGDREALRILATVREATGLPVLTDIHAADEAEMAAQYVDYLQIPAFLCRQTDLLLAAARTGLPVNIKKGQFLSPEAMHFAVEKVRQGGDSRVAVTDRGTMFGYQDLVVDMRAIPRMQQGCGCPVILDITHSLQRPNQAGGVTGGDPDLIATIGSAGVAAGADGVFIETHPNPSEAKSDGANMLALDLLPGLLLRLKAIADLTRQLNARS